MSQPTVAAQAEALARRYATVCGSGKGLMGCPKGEQASIVQRMATEAAACYLPGTVHFGRPNGPATWANQDDGFKAIKFIIERQIAVGAGMNVSLKDLRVEEISDDGNGVGSAVCFVTWHWVPEKGCGIEPYDSKVVYGYRKKGDGSEGWEFSIADNELAVRAKFVDYYAI